MKKRHLGVLILLIILAFVGGYLWQITHQLGELTYVVQKITLGSEKDKYQIEAEYPLIGSGIPEVVKNKINTELEKWVKVEVEKAKEDFEGMLKDPELTRSDLGLTYLSKVTVRNDFIKLPYINVSFQTYTYSGGAHGITAINTFVYDARTGQKIGLDDFLQGNYLQKISELSLQKIEATDPKLETYSFAIEGTKPLEENFQNWTLESDGIHIIFSDYQVGPYVVGRPEITIPYDSVQSVLTDDFKKFIRFIAPTR